MKKRDAAWLTVTLCTAGLITWSILRPVSQLGLIGAPDMAASATYMLMIVGPMVTCVASYLVLQQHQIAVRGDGTSMGWFPLSITVTLGFAAGAGVLAGIAVLQRELFDSGRIDLDLWLVISAFLHSMLYAALGVGATGLKPRWFIVPIVGLTAWTIPWAFAGTSFWLVNPARIADFGGIEKTMLYRTVSIVGLLALIVLGVAIAQWKLNNAKNHVVIAASVLALIATVVPTPETYQAQNRPVTCMGDAPKVCVLEPHRGTLAEFDSAVRGVTVPLRQAGFNLPDVVREGFDEDSTTQTLVYKIAYPPLASNLKPEDLAEGLLFRFNSDCDSVKFEDSDYKLVRNAVKEILNNADTASGHAELVAKYNAFRGCS